MLSAAPRCFTIRRRIGLQWQQTVHRGEVSSIIGIPLKHPNWRLGYDFACVEKTYVVHYALIFTF